MKIAVITIIIIFISILSLYVYYGGTRKIKTKKGPAGGEILAYREVNGDYRQSGPVSNDVYDQLLNLGVETFRGFGIYYDDPRKVSRENLRSEVGCIIEEKDLDKLEKVKEILQVKVLMKKQYLRAVFPYRNPFSSFMGIVKVHPVLEKEAKSINPDFAGFIMEIWDIPNKKIEYLKEIE